jgi:hypothetical protein
MAEMKNCFVDGVVSVSYADNVFRVIFGQQTSGDKVTEHFCMYIPGNQMKNVVETLAGSLRGIGEKLKEQEDQNAAEATNLH